MLFCAYMAFIYMPFDLFWKPVEQDMEVWFGFGLHGWYAKATEPLHWAIYGAATRGFWKMRPWMWPWASVYMAQIAIGMLIWSLTDERGTWPLGLAAMALIGVPTVALWRARDAFQPPAMRTATGDTPAG